MFTKFAKGWRRRKATYRPAPQLIDLGHQKKWCEIMLFKKFAKGWRRRRRRRKATYRPAPPLIDLGHQKKWCEIMLFKKFAKGWKRRRRRKATYRPAPPQVKNDYKNTLFRLKSEKNDFWTHKTITSQMVYNGHIILAIWGNSRLWDF